MIKSSAVLEKGATLNTARNKNSSGNCQNAQLQFLSTPSASWGQKSIQKFQNFHKRIIILRAKIKQQIILVHFDDNDNQYSLQIYHLQNIISLMLAPLSTILTRKNTAKFNQLDLESQQLAKRRIQSLKKIRFVPSIDKIKEESGPNNQDLLNEENKNQYHQHLQQNNQFPEQSKDRRSKSPKHRLNSNKKLSPIKQYETKLKISSQCWLVYDYRHDSYKRGWRPADMDQYNGVARLLIFKVYTQLAKSNPKIKNFTLRVNTKYLKEEIQIMKEQKQPLQKRKGLIIRQGIDRLLGNNVIINVVDLLYALLMTNFDDIVEYGIIFMGYLCDCHSKGIQPFPEDSQWYFVQKISQALANAGIFAMYVNDILFPSLQMKQSNFKAESYLFSTSANDICRLYLSLEEHPLFREILVAKQIRCNVKYQIGFKYWQNRVLNIKNTRIELGPNYDFFVNWKGAKNYSVICRNLSLNILIILQDCKFGMAEIDVHNVESWVKELMKPIIDKRKTHNKLLPLLRIGDSPPKVDFRKTRTLTEGKEQQSKQISY